MASLRTSELRPALLAALLCLLPALPAAAGVSFIKPGEPLVSIAAVVNDDVVLSSDLEAELEEIRVQIRERGGQVPADRLLRRQVIERLVLRKLQLQLAANIGMSVPDDELDATIGDIAKRNQMTIEALAAEIAGRGMDFAAYREDVREELVLERIRRQEVERRAAVTPREVDQFLALNAESDDAEYLVSHILIALRGQATPEEIQKNQERAQATYEHITVKGNEFKATVTAYSDAPDALEGGSLGWRRRAQLPTVFADAVTKMKPGDVSPPIRSSAGFHIMRLDEKRQGKSVLQKQVHSRHILIKPDQIRSVEDVKAKLEDLRKQLAAGAKFEDLARAHSEDPGTKPDGGVLDWTEPSTFTPEFAEKLETLPIGEVSEPFATQFGWHIVEVLGRREQDVTEQAKRGRASAQLRQRKIEEQGQLWLQRLRDEAFVELRGGS